MDSRTSVIPYLEAGLRAVGLRGKAIANNLANLNTPGYRRVAVEFETSLAKAIAKGDLRGVRATLLRPMTSQVHTNGNDVDLDTEVGALIKNAAVYKTFMRVLAKQYRQMELAIRREF